MAENRDSDHEVDDGVSASRPGSLPPSGAGEARFRRRGATWYGAAMARVSRRGEHRDSLAGAHWGDGGAGHRAGVGREPRSYVN